MTKTLRSLAALLATAAWLGGCIAATPEARLEQDLGPEEVGVPQGENHRPGQPCLTCHGPTHNPGGEEFELAGTIYRRPGDTEGLSGVTVEFQDADGRSHTSRTNRVGTFYLEKGDFDPKFPLRVKIRKDGIEQVMQGLIWREGSCAACHGGGPSAGSNGIIYLEGEAP